MVCMQPHKIKFVIIGDVLFIRFVDCCFCCQLQAIHSMPSLLGSAHSVTQWKGFSLIFFSETSCTTSQGLVDHLCSADPGWETAP